MPERVGGLEPKGNPPVAIDGNDGERIDKLKLGAASPIVWAMAGFMPSAYNPPCERRLVRGTTVVGGDERPPQVSKLRILHCRPGLEPGPIPREVGAGTMLWLCCDSPEPAVGMGPRSKGRCGGLVVTY